MMRYITSHVVNPVNDKLEISVLDEPGAGGANHEYLITTPAGREPRKPYHEATSDEGRRFRISFQNGPINEHGVNGVTQEALLAIVADRLQSFQDGPFACNENQVALTHVRDAMTALQSRTKARMERGVEGTNQK